MNVSLHLHIVTPRGVTARITGGLSNLRYHFPLLCGKMLARRIGRAVVVALSRRIVVVVATADGTPY